MLSHSNILGIGAGRYPEGHDSDPVCYFKILHLVKFVILCFPLKNLVCFPHFCLTLTSMRTASAIFLVPAVPKSSTVRGVEQVSQPL